MALGDTIRSLTSTNLANAAGTVVYDDVTFSALRTYTFRCEPVYDEADWTVTHLRYTLRLHGWIMADSINAQETAMDNLHTKLTRPGRKLQISGLGFDTAVDTAYNGGENPDIAWGPKPRLLDFKPAGGRIAWEFDWEVEWTVFRALSPGNYPKIAAFNYSAAYDIDEQGLTVRTLEGYFETIQARKANAKRELDNDALEGYWNRANISLPYGFRRVRVARRLSLDRRRLNFVVVDQEFQDTAFPQGIVAADVEHEFANEPPGFIRWHSVISGSLTVAKGYPKSLAAQKFFLILADVAAKARTVAHASDIGGTVIPVRIKFSTQKFGRTSRFFVAFTMAACLEEILSKSGIWNAVPGTNWQQWASSMRNAGVGTPNGVARLWHSHNDDKLIDLEANQAVISIGNDRTLPVKNDGLAKNDSLCPNPTPRNSYLHFNNRIQAVENANAVTHRRAQAGAPLDTKTTAQASLDVPLTAASGLGGGISGGAGNDNIIGGPGGGSGATDRPGAAHTVQYVSEREQLFIMYGDAVRMKWEPEIPQLKSIGGVPVEKLAQSIDVGPAAAFFDCPMYTARWTILYLVKGYAKTMKAPRNKFLCVKEGADDGRKK